MEVQQLSPQTVADDPIRAIRSRPVRVSPKTVWSFVEVEAADGTVGIGEATFFRAAHDIPQVVEEFAARLVGQPLATLTDPPPLPADSDVIGWAVLSALEHAAWDIAGKRAKKPVHALLGGALHDEIHVYANINRRTVDRTPAGFEASVRAALMDGYDKMKIAPFDGVTPADGALFDAGLARIRAAHAALNGQGVLMVDCHWHLSLDRACVLLELAEQLGLGWIECPLPETATTMDQLHRFKSLARDAGIKVAGAEQGTSLNYFDRILREGIYDVIMPDVKYVGGIRNLVAIARLADKYGVAFSPHNPSGPIAHLATLHAMAVMERPGLMEHQFDEAPLFWTFAGENMPAITNAVSLVPARSGL